MKMKTLLFCPGAQKAGTTSLRNFLKQHPDIYNVRQSKLKIYDTDSNEYLKYYEGTCKDAGDSAYILDVTPNSIMYDDLPGKMHEIFGADVQFIFMLRNPVDRAYSSYMMNATRLIENLSFKEAIETEEERINRDKKSFRNFTYIKRGFYAQQIEKFLEFYPVENMQFIIFEEFIKNIESIGNGILEKLGLSRDSDIDYNVWSNKTRNYKHPWIAGAYNYVSKSGVRRYIKKLFNLFSSDTQNNIRNVVFKKGKKHEIADKDEKLCRELMQLYIADIKKLETIIKKDLSFWIEKYS